jgi:hypothetical protein
MSNGSRPRRAMSLILALLGFLALGLMAPAVANAGPDGKSTDAPADQSDNKHPSGKDRQADSTSPQGRSESDPDGDSNGGTDKPGAVKPASGDAADRDGNNGCGNDDDFEDDNNGKCLRKGHDKTEVKGTSGERKPEQPCPDCGKQGSTQLQTEVKGITAENTGTVTAAPQPIETEVLGVAVTRAETAAAPTQAAAPAEVASAAQESRPTSVLGNVVTRGAAPLARTGLTVGLIALVGMALVTAGQALRKAGGDN